MLPELHTRTWMSSRRNPSMITGMSMVHETCRFRGQVSHNLLYWKKTLTDICCLGVRLTWKQLTSRPDHLWPEIWKTMGRNDKLKGKQKWSNEKLHLDNARKLRGIKLLTLRTRILGAPSRMLVRNWKRQWFPLCLAKIMKKNCGSGESNKSKTKLACDESTRMRLGNSIPNHHEDHIEGKGDNSLQHYNFVTNWLILMPQAMKNSCSKRSGGQGMGKLENFGVELDESQK